LGNPPEPTAKTGSSPAITKVPTVNISPEQAPEVATIKLGFIPIVETEEWRKIPSFRVVQDFDTNIIYNKTPGEIKIMLDDNIAEELYTGGENLSQYEVREVYDE